MLSYISQVFHDNCVVNFAPPDDDGGTEIVKYVVEEMNVTEGGGWSEVAEVGPGDKKAKIDGLNSGDKYRFRVKAINKLGQVSTVSRLNSSEFHHLNITFTEHTLRDEGW